jgi:hypothetical protein
VRWALFEALCLSAGLSLAMHTATPIASAEEPGKPAKHSKPRKKRARAQKPAPKPAQEKPAQERQEHGPTAIAAAQAAAGASNAQIVKEGDTSVKVMSFEGLGIEGRLKSPQLVYFVQRVQAEFARPVLPHRSFMPELQDTTAREPVR